MSSVVLAVDLGGTKVFTQLANLQGEVIFEQRFNSASYADFAELLVDFFQYATPAEHQIVSTCLAVAGPVVEQRSELTNLPWVIDSQALASQFPLGEIRLCNDFVAVAYGIDLVAEQDKVCLQTGELDPFSPRSVIGAGTGLGQAYMLPHNEGWDVVATEGGNVDFGPRDDEQVALLRYLMPKMSHVSYERLLSGPGLEWMYQFLLQRADQPSVRMTAGDISQCADTDPYADQAMRLFMRIYGAQAGNTALNVIARGGIYIAGGIAAKNQTYLLNDDFMAAFLNKGKMASLMRLMPVVLITDEKVGLSGARHLALQEAV